jgi:cytoskeletal protein CcmA (bactofilin family)
MNGGGSELDGLLAQGTQVTGTLRFEKAVKIDGQFEGKVESSGKLILGPTAKVDAELSVGELEVEGVLRGEVKAAQRILIRDGGVVEANIVTSRLAIETGAIFRGHCEMPEQKQLPSSPPGDKPKEKEKADKPGPGAAPNKPPQNPTQG